MRALAPVLILVLAAPLAPLAGAAGSAVWSLDAEISFLDESKARMLARITYDATYYGSTWRLAVPTGATFVKAQDAEGNLPASVSDGTVTVTTRGHGASYAFELIYALPVEAEGPFLRLRAQTSAASDTPTTLRLAPLDGWSLAGWDGADELVQEDALTWRATGPTLLDLVLLAPGVVDPGPNPRVAGASVLREARAVVEEGHVAVNLTTTYDTHVYGPWWNVTLPENATDVAVSTPFGTLAAPVEDGVVHVRAPYPFHAGLQARSFHVAYRTPLDAFGDAFRVANLSVRAAKDDPVTLRVALPDGYARTGALVTGGEAWDEHGEGAGVAGFRSTGPLHVRLSMLPPAGSGMTRFTEGPFVVQVPDAWAPAARATASAAAEMLPTVAGFAGGAEVVEPFFVVYTGAPIFQWEEGFYRSGTNAIAIRLDSLEEANDGKAHLGPVTTLVHEATHGLVDRIMPDEESDLSFLKEGLSRLAEIGVEARFPDEVIRCESGPLRTSCERQSVRLVAEDLQAFHLQGGTFDASWTAHGVGDDERGFLYDYSGLVFAAYQAAAPEGALDRVLHELAGDEPTEDTDLRAQQVVAALLARAPGLTREALLYPGRAQAGLPPAEFHAAMGGLVAPPFPFEEDDGDAGPIAVPSLTPMPAWLPLAALAGAGAALGCARKNGK